MTEFRNYDSAAWKLTDEQKKFFENMEKELERPIVVISGGGGRRERDVEEFNDDVLIFFDYATNSMNPTPRRIDALSRRNGTQVKLPNHFLLKPDDREYIFDFNNFPLCEMRMNTLWGLTPLQNFETEALLKEFWADAIRMSTNTDFFAKKEEEKRRKIKDAFINTMKASSEAEVKSQEAVVNTKSQQLADVNTQAVAVQTELIRSQQRLAIARKMIEGDEELYEGEITSLLRHSQIKTIDFDTANGILEVHTHLLYLYSPDQSERSPLGQFVIRVNTRNNNSVTLHNMTNQRSGKMHPHVESNGAACWGAIGPQIAKLAASGKIEGLADLVIRYLESYNVQDGNAQYARYWFTEKDKQKERPDFDNTWMNQEEYKVAKEEASKKKEKVVESKGKEKVEDEVTKVTTLTEKELEELNV